MVVMNNADPWTSFQENILRICLRYVGFDVHSTHTKCIIMRQAFYLVIKLVVNLAISMPRVRVLISLRAAEPFLGNTRLKRRYTAWEDHWNTTGGLHFYDHKLLRIKKKILCLLWQWPSKTCLPVASVGSQSWKEGPDDNTNKCLVLNHWWLPYIRASSWTSHPLKFQKIYHKIQTHIVLSLYRCIFQGKKHNLNSYSFNWYS